MGSKSRFVVVGVGVVAAFVVAVGVAAASGTISTFTLASKAGLSSNGKAVTLSGTITCTQGDEVEIDGSVTQVSGRVVSGASEETFVLCNGDEQSWSLTAGSPLTLPFKPGKAEASVTVSDLTDFGFALVTTTVNVGKNA